MSARLLQPALTQVCTVTARRARTALVVVLALVASLFTMLATVVVAPPASATIAVTAARTTSGFPTWYEDQGGTRLEPCLDPNDVHCVVLSNPPIYDAAQPTVWPTNFPDEWFYSVVDSDVLNTPGCAGTKPGKALVRHALEGTFLNGIPVPGDQMVFARTRITVSSGLCPGQNYTFTTPYGAITLQMDSAGGIKKNLSTTDIGCLAAPCDFTAPLTAPMFQNFLRWDPAVAPAATPGYLSADAGVLHPITGAVGAGSANLFRVTGPGLAAPLSTNLFTVAGKIAGPLQSDPEFVDLGNQLQPINIPSDPRTVTFTNVTKAALPITGVSINPAASPWLLDPANPTTCTGSIPAGGTCTATILFAPQAIGTFTANLEVTHGSFRSPTQVALKGSGTSAATPSVTSAPDSLSFGRVLNGTTSAAKGVVIHNNGPGRYVIDGVSVVDVPAGQVGNAQRFLPIASNDCPAAGLQPGLDCTIMINFKPVSQQPSAAQLQINGHVGATTVNKTADLTGRGGIATSASGLDGLGPDGVGTDGFTTWYQDDRGVRLNQCLVNDPAKCILLADPTFNPAAPISFPANYPGEGFYYALDSDVINTPGCGAASPAGKAGFRAAVEQTFVSGSPVAGEQMVFDRMRMNVTSGLCPGRDYTFVTPYGEYTFTADASGALPRNAGTTDIGCVPTPTTPCNFNLAVTSPVSDGFVRWDNTAPAAPAGYLGDAGVLHTVTGAPYAKPGSSTPQNQVEIIDTTDNSVVASTNLFTVMGQIDPTQTATRYQTVNPASLAFGSQDVGTTSAAQTVQVDSVGTAALNVTGVTVTGPDAAAFTATTTCANQAVGTNCPVTVTFTPTAGGAANATLNVTSDAANGFTGSIPLTGTGVVPNAPVISVAPTSVAFGNQRTGAAATAKTVTVSNTGTQPLTVTGLTVGGTEAADFTATGCGAAIPAGGSCDITVGFTPGAAGARAATLTIASDAVNAASVVVNLSGTGTAPAISVTPASLAFGNQAVTTTSAAQTVTVTNTGTAPLNVTAVTVGGVDGADFAATGCAAAVVPGGTCTVGVTFSPGTIGAKTASLTIASDADTQAAPVALTGTGVQAQIAVTPATLTFTDQLVGSTSAAQTVTVSNPGTSPLNITGLTVGGANAADFTAGGCAAAVAPGGTCTVTVAFTPGATGTRTATLSIASNAAGGTVTVDLTGTGALPQITVAPASVDFGDQLVASTSASRTVRVSNPGTVPLTVSSVVLSGTNGADFAATGCAAAVAPGGSCTVSVTFRPGATGARTGTLTIASNAAGADLTVTLTGNGVAPAASVAPAAVTFGSIAVGTPATAQTVTLSNTGTAPLTVSGITLTGANAGDFASTGTCTTVAPGGTCTVSVGFTPLAAGARAATLTFTTDATPSAIAVPLTGTGTAADITLSATALAFGNRLVASTSPAQTVTITNPGNAPLVISANSLTGTDAADFALTTTCGTPVAPGGTCTYSVTFTPGTTGAKTASLQLTTNATPSLRTISLTGTGVAPAASVAPTSLTFANTVVGSTAAAQTVTLSNPGSSVLTVSGVTITGANATEFARTTTCTTVPAGGSCTVSVTFTPTAAGTRTGTLSIATDAGTQSVPLTGTGVTPQLVLTPTALTFPNTSLAVSSAAQVITVTNPGNAALTISGITVGGTNAADFTRTTTCGATVPAAGSCTISVVFRPSANGTRTGTISVASNAGTQVATLTGTGGFPVASFSTLSLLFGNQPLTTTSAVQNVTITNNGAAPLTVSSAVLAGTNPGDFTVTNGCAAPVAVGGTCTLGVAFRPTVAAARTASLTVTSNAQPATSTVSLSGTGINATVPGAPTIGAVTRGNASATVTWTAPANGGTPITGYLVQPFVGGVANGAPRAAGATATSLVVTGLTNGTAYTFRVTAQNILGTGAQSAASAAVTPATVPDAPAAPALARAAGSVTATWTAPPATANGGSAITGYNVRIIDPAGTQVAIATVTATTLTRTFTGLINGTVYRAQVQATNAVGTGAFSAASNAVTFANVPATPAAPTVAQGVAGGATTVRVTWVAPNNNADGITSFTLRAQRYTLGLIATGTFTTFVVTPVPGTNTAEITLPTVGLDNYRIAVQATNSLGSSAFSAESAGVTPR